MQSHSEWFRVHLIYIQVDSWGRALEEPIDRVPRPVNPTDMLNDSLRHCFLCARST